MNTLCCSLVLATSFFSLDHCSFWRKNCGPKPFLQCSDSASPLVIALCFIITHRHNPPIQTQTTQTSSPSSSAPSPAPAPSLRRWKVFAVTLFLYGASCNSLWSKVERRVPMQTSVAPITLLSPLEDKTVKTKRVTSCLTEWRQRLRGSHMTTQEMEKQTSVGTFVWVCQRNSTLLVFSFFFFLEYLSVLGFLVLHRWWKRWFISKFTKSNVWSIQKK